MIITNYYNTYRRFDPSVWTWKCENESFFRYRGRPEGNILPDFHDVERDADRFNMKNVHFVDIFGLTWCGEKGGLVNVGSPDYEGHLYYDKFISGNYEYIRCVSEKYTIYNPPENYISIIDHGVKIWVNYKDIIDAEYMYILNNHLFKDSRLQLRYNCQVYNVYEIDTFVKVLINKLGLDNQIVAKILNRIDKHFLDLKNSNDPAIKKFWPGMTSIEFFTKGN
jgi:hypothetical protein